MSEEDFEANIEYLIKRDPEHNLLPLIKTGYSYINVFYLETAINELPPVVDTSPGDDEVSNTEPQERMHPALKDLAKKKMHLVNSIRKLSNDFHTSPNDSYSADISKRIKKLIRQKKDIQASIDFYRDNPQIATHMTDEMKNKIPDNELELYKRRKALKDNIRYHERQLQRYIEKGDQVMIDEREIILKSKKLELAHVKRAISTKC